MKYDGVVTPLIIGYITNMTPSIRITCLLWISSGIPSHLIAIIFAKHAIIHDILDQIAYTTVLTSCFITLVPSKILTAQHDQQPSVASQTLGTYAQHAPAIQDYARLLQNISSSVSLWSLLIYHILASANVGNAPVLQNSVQNLRLWVDISCRHRIPTEKLAL